jgi:Holliday junction resolvase RusA-like endonuclease
MTRINDNAAIKAAPYVLEFTLHGLPARTNSAHTSWRARHAEARKWKSMVVSAVILKRAKPAWPLTKAKLTLTRHSSIRPDADGLVSGFKHVVDGLIEAGVIIDDNMDVIGMPTYEWKKAPQRNGFITVRVEEVL